MVKFKCKECGDISNAQSLDHIHELGKICYFCRSESWNRTTCPNCGKNVVRYYNPYKKVIYRTNICSIECQQKLYKSDLGKVVRNLVFSYHDKRDIMQDVDIQIKEVAGKTGRPKKQETEKADKTFTFRLKQSEKDLISKMADDELLSVSNYVRKVVLAHIRKED